MLKAESWKRTAAIGRVLAMVPGRIQSEVALNMAVCEQHTGHVAVRLLFRRLRVGNDCIVLVGARDYSSGSSVTD
jgi:hypothetical protein